MNLLSYCEVILPKIMFLSIL